MNQFFANIGSEDKANVPVGLHESSLVRQIRVKTWLHLKNFVPMDCTCGEQVESRKPPVGLEIPD